MQIDFVDETDEVKEEHLKLLTDLLNQASKKEGVTSDAELSITFVNNDEIQVINKEYRQKDSPTDVISFAMQESVEGEMEIKGADMPVILGDIIISIEKTKEQALDYGHSFERELGFLAVHGLLHLLGYDHMTEQDEKAMFARQEEILHEFGLQR
jgi:probable rRNA maturation factor